MADKELKISAEKVREAAKMCPEWERGLKKLFPEAFEVSNKGRITYNPETGAFKVKVEGYSLPLEIRTGGKHKGTGIYLPTVNGFTWKVVKDDEDAYVLICQQD